MYPYLHNKDVVLAVRDNFLSKGEVVKAIDNEGFIVVKRIVWVKGNLVFLEGDNKNESVDSRQIGPVHKSQIKGVICGMF